MLREMSARLVAGVCSDMRAFAPHRDEWRKLATATGSIFVTPEWAEAWFGVYDDYEPSIRYVLHDGRLVAVMPLMIGDGGDLRFIGDGVGDFFEPIVAPDAPAGAAAALLGTLGTDKGELVVLTNVEKEAEWRKGLGPALEFRALVDRQELLPYIDLRGLDWAGFLATRSSNLRSQLGRKQRALERGHVVTVRRTLTHGELMADVARLFQLHDMRWDARGGSTASSQRMRRFLCDLSMSALDAGWLRLWTMDFDGDPIAAWLGWRIGSRYSYYLAGFDPAHGVRSPGLLLLARTIQEAIGEGCSEYDFLLGGEVYKLRFANAQRSVETEILGSAWSSRFAIARLEQVVRRVGRRLPLPLRTRVQDVAARFQQPLPLGRHR
jgi:CelD/BcsL family acetyltransferase involved in cellulose biosynthesis